MLDNSQPDPRKPDSARQLDRRSCIKALAGTIGAVSAANVSRANEKLGQVLGRRSTGPSIFKARASAEYTQSLSRVGGRLANAREELLCSKPRHVPWQFDVLVVGSGYGASTVAARLAQRRLPTTRIAILERGKEWVPGTFPDCLPEVLKESRLTLLGRKKGQTNNATGLFNVEQFDELTVLSGCGLGGGSLINASVAIRPDREVFEQEIWPAGLRSRDFLDPYYELAELELCARVEPLDRSHKMFAQRMASSRLTGCGACWQPAKLVVSRTGDCPADSPPTLNAQGMLQRGCIDCGDCLTGCNVGAKNTLAMNYLPMARFAGAEIYTAVEVTSIRKVQEWYEVYFDQHCQMPDGSIVSEPGCTTAQMVMLGAGSLGSSAILMRSQACDMEFSPRLGCNWTGNGDALGFIRKTENATGIGGYSAYPTDRYPVGPTIQSNWTYPNRTLPYRVLIQEGAVPRAYATALGFLMRDLKLTHTQVLLGMGHDGAEGRIWLNERGQPQVAWPGLLESPYRQLIRQEFQQVACGMGGEYEFLKIFGDRMISVHPLGGCAMADNCWQGVVNDGGQVYDPRTGGVHAGLYVVDGAVLPTSIACNPLLTITAIAERMSDRIVNNPELGHLFVPEQSTV